VSFDLIDLVLQAGLIVKIVLLILAGFSVVSWAIIGAKWLELRSADQDSEAFLEVYHRSPADDAYEAARHLDRSPLVLIFLTVSRQLGQPASGSEDDRLRNLRRVVRRTAAEQANRLERGLTFLATTGSSAPFIGLFGTVVGIIAAFQQIGATGNATLATVGPGIAEALVATAVGLLAAIPASIAYNGFVGHLERIAAAVDRFSDEFSEDLARLVGQRPGVAAVRGD